MGKITGFKEYKRELPPQRDPKVRVNDFNELYEKENEQLRKEQAARCMDCGVPFCHNGCPLGNNIPDFNDAAYRGDWEGAIEVLSRTNNFPEFTGRICPAPCEASCVLGINKPPVAIEFIEKSIAEKAFKLGLIKADPPQNRTGKRVAVVGSGPAGLAAAAQLNKAGHEVTIFEKNSQPGGLLRYGIPDFKMEKWVIERRVQVMEAEGVQFRTNTHVGKDISAEELNNTFDAVVLCCGAEVPRDLPLKGRELQGVHFAMDFLTQQNRRLNGEAIGAEEIWAEGKNVVVIGGGDTGADCVGTSNRQKAQSVSQIELLQQPPLERSEENPWPQWPLILRTSSSHEEGCERNWAMQSKEFVGDGEGRLRAVKVVDVMWRKDESGRMAFFEVEGSEREIPCELALIAIGFVHTQPKGLLEELGIELDARGNVYATNYQTNIPNIFTAGDVRRGQSLVVWAISEGREAARAVDTYLMGETALPSKNKSAIDLMVG
ncbi:glutamate synthase subunit beta [Nafulsella turpanensis]|uniref:glutamate synthase subunit beta n=1 Tax=Nafulsella turpanensis TaxID=1265690 RepID=UPI000349B3AD|nr:glutamate synthase subunit beta [Nafulsella turpanensis]